MTVGCVLVVMESGPEKESDCGLISPLSLSLPSLTVQGQLCSRHLTL